MKKLCVFLSIICLCSFVLTSCTTPIDAKPEATEDASEATTLSQEEQQELEEKLKTVKKTIEGLLKAETEEEISKYVTELPDGYAENVLETSPHNDYIVTVTKLGEYNHYDAYRVRVKRKADKEFSMSGVELFKMTDRGYLIETNEEFSEKVRQNKACPTCNGFGYVVVETGDCPVCEGLGMVYNEKAVYDKSTKTWKGQNEDCTACKGTGEANNTESICKTCDGACLVF